VIRTSIAPLAVDAGLTGASSAAENVGPTPYKAALQLSAGRGAAVLEGWHANEPCRELPCDKPGRLQKSSLSCAVRIAEEVVKGG
jgi:hypothetical protein